MIEVHLACPSSNEWTGVEIFDAADAGRFQSDRIVNGIGAVLSQQDNSLLTYTPFTFRVQAQAGSTGAGVARVADVGRGEIWR